tara:strand:+ start:7902 stop:9371 length:1470 start_codon:yes stop_codon:yes gene_type:complete
MEHTSAFLPSELWNKTLFTGSWDSSDLSPTQVIEPATGDELGQICLADPAAVAASARAAREAQVEWSALPHEARASVLRKAAQLAEANQGELMDWLVRESGSTQLKAGFEVSITAKSLYESSGLPGLSQGEVLPSVPGRLSLARRRPLGVVGVISPFNFPLYLAMRAVAPALALGNSVVLKPDPRTAVSGGMVIARLFELAGLPKGVLHVLPGAGDAGVALVEDPNVAMIQFTGSTAAGRKVGELAGRHLKKVSLELGGKNSLIVLDDADIDLAVANAVWGSFLHQGQICMATGRILVQRSVYNAFLERLVAKTSSLIVGDPAKYQVAIGPLINAQQRDSVAALVQSAKDAGAKLEVGGTYIELFFRPTVLSEVGADNPAFQAEIFGPVALVVPFDTDEEAVCLSNDTEYGLSSGIISRNVGRALALGERLRTGLLHINDQTVNDDVINPFGGVGASGNGTSIGGPANWEEFTQWQWVTVKGECIPYAL